MVLVLVERASRNRSQTTTPVRAEETMARGRRICRRDYSVSFLCWWQMIYFVFMALAEGFSFGLTGRAPTSNSTARTDVVIKLQDSANPNWIKWKQDYDRRGGFAPLVEVFGLRALAQHHADKLVTEFAPKAVRTGDSVHLSADWLGLWASKVHPYISVPYILIVADEGGWMPHNCAECLRLIHDPKVSWFTWSPIISNHPRFSPLPMGPFYYLWQDSVNTSLFLQLASQEAKAPGTRDTLLHIAFSTRREGRRWEVDQLFANFSHAPPQTIVNRNRPPRRASMSELWRELLHADFILSPA